MPVFASRVGAARMQQLRLPRLVARLGPGRPGYIIIIYCLIHFINRGIQSYKNI